MPVAIVRQAGDIPLHALRPDAIIKPARMRVAIGIGSMNNHQSAAVAGFGSVVAGFQEQAEVGKVVVYHLARGPEHANVDFIANLHAVRGRALRLQRATDAKSTIIDIALQLTEAVIRPGSRFGLMPGRSAFLQERLIIYADTIQKWTGPK